jgi:triosephosphate isomerase
MDAIRRPLVAGNWKMNGGLEGAAVLARDIAAGSGDLPCELLVCPPAVYLHGVARMLADADVAVGGQDCHGDEAGAHTGDISAGMLRDCGCGYVIVGHSERRADHGEDDAAVCAKAAAAHRAGLIAIVCVGETGAERDAGRAHDVVARQLGGSLPDSTNSANTVIAYEPVWAIGTGRTPTPDEVQAVHQQMRALVAKNHGAAFGDQVRLLYGGSVNPGNAMVLMALADVDGALVGGASLKAGDFLAIAKSTGHFQNK